MSLNEIADTFGYKNNKFLLEKAQNNIKKFDFNKFNLSFEALCEADKGLKSFGTDARIVLEKLAVKLGYIALKGESVD